MNQTNDVLLCRALSPPLRHQLRATYTSLEVKPGALIPFFSIMLFRSTTLEINGTDGDMRLRCNMEYQGSGGNDPDPEEILKQKLSATTAVWSQQEP